MEEEFRKPLLTKAILTAVFVGFVATLVCIFFNVIFVENTRFPLHTLINVSTLIFGVNTIFFAIGFFYYGFMQIKRGELFFIILFLLLTAFFVWRGEHFHRSDDPNLNVEFREQLTVIVLIIGLTAAVLLPVLFHSRKFEDKVI